jgi:hypothetical protein
VIERLSDCATRGCRYPILIETERSAPQLTAIGDLRWERYGAAFVFITQVVEGKGFRRRSRIQLRDAGDVAAAAADKQATASALADGFAATRAGIGKGGHERIVLKQKIDELISV